MAPASDSSAMIPPLTNDCIGTFAPYKCAVDGSCVLKPILCGHGDLQSRGCAFGEVMCPEGNCAEDQNCLRPCGFSQKTYADTKLSYNVACTGFDGLCAHEASHCPPSPLECTLDGRNHYGWNLGGTTYTATLSRCIEDCRRNAECAGTSHAEQDLQGSMVCFPHEQIHVDQIREYEKNTLYIKDCREYREWELSLYNATAAPADESFLDGLGPFKLTALIVGCILLVVVCCCFAVIAKKFWRKMRQSNPPRQSKSPRSQPTSPPRSQATTANCDEEARRRAMAAMGNPGVAWQPPAPPRLETELDPLNQHGEPRSKGSIPVSGDARAMNQDGGIDAPLDALFLM